MHDVANLVPRVHVPFGQHQATELWNNQFPETKILGLPVSRRMRGLVYLASRDIFDVDTFNKSIQYAKEKLGKSKFGFERTGKRFPVPLDKGNSFSEPTCLLVSTKTRSSGIISKLVPRSLVSFASKI